MAGTSLLALIDDIATLLDDVAVMTKVAARQGMSAADDVAAMTQMAAKKTASRTPRSVSPSTSPSTYLGALL